MAVSRFRLENTRITSVPLLSYLASISVFDAADEKLELGLSVERSHFERLVSRRCQEDGDNGLVLVVCNGASLSARIDANNPLRVELAFREAPKLTSIEGEVGSWL